MRSLAAIEKRGAGRPTPASDRYEKSVRLQRAEIEVDKAMQEKRQKIAEAEGETKSAALIGAVRLQRPACALGLLLNCVCLSTALRTNTLASSSFDWLFLSV